MHLQDHGELVKRLHRDVFLAALHTTDIGRLNRSACANRFLRPTLGGTESTKVEADKSANVHRREQARVADLGARAYRSMNPWCLQFIEGGLDHRTDHGAHSADRLFL